MTLYLNQKENSNMKVTYAYWEDDPVVIVKHDDGTAFYVNREKKGWTEDGGAVMAKIVNKETWKRMFPDAGMPKIDDD